MQIKISEDGFLNLLTQQNGGSLIEELDRELMKGIGAILDLGGSADISLKIKIARVPNMETAVSITHDVIAKHPKEPRPAKAMFVTIGNGLSVQHQEQQSLGLGEAQTAVKGRLSDASTDSKVSQLNP